MGAHLAEYESIPEVQGLSDGRAAATRKADGRSDEFPTEEAEQRSESLSPKNTTFGNFDFYSVRSADNVVQANHLAPSRIFPKKII